jgi:hypothetical protein
MSFGTDSAKKPYPLKMMFKQQAFDAYAEIHPWAALVGTLFFSFVLLVMLCADIMALPKYMANRHLIGAGAQGNGIVDSRAVQTYKPGKSRTEHYEITVRYHFTARDGHRYESTSKVDTLDPVLVVNGMSIAVLYDPTDPNRSGWDMSLKQAIGNFYVALGLTPLVWLWLGLFIYRYVRWRGRFPNQPTTKDHSLMAA